MLRKFKVIINVLAIIIVSMGMLVSAKAEDINIGSFRNIIAGSQPNITFTNVNVKQQENGWKKVDNHWYYFKEGTKITGWFNDAGTWYYFNTDGSMASNTTIDKYYLNYNGAWVNK